MQTLLKKITALTVKQQMIGVTIGIIVVACLFYMALIVPQRERIADLKTHFDSEQARLKIIDSFSAQHPQLENYLTEIDQKIARTDALLPDDPDMSAFMIQLQQAARETQVELTRLAPGIYLNKTGYYEIPIEVGVRGSFFKVSKFIQRCETLGRFTSIETVNMQIKDGGLLECKIPVVIYAFGVAPVQATAAPNQPQKQALPVAPATPATPAPVAK